MRGWIKWDKGLAKKPEIYRIAKIMGISRREAATACMEAWEWADDTMDVDGRVDATVDAIDDAAGLPGLAKAMQEVGWLAEGDTVYMPGYAEHNGPTGRTRDLKNARQARWRDGKASTERLHGRLPAASQNRLPDEDEEKKKILATEQQGAVAPAAGAASSPDDHDEAPPLALSNAPPPKPPTPLSGAEKLAADMAAAERRRNRAPAPVVVPIPILLDTEPFRLRWASWLQYRREMKKPLTPTSQAQQLDNFLKIGEARAIAMIEHTITMGWQGLREPEAPAANGGSLPYLKLPTPEERAASRAKEPEVLTQEQIEARALIERVSDEYEARQAAKAAAKAQQEPKP